MIVLTIIGGIVVANVLVYAISLALQCYELGECPEWSFVYWLMPEWTDALPFIPSVSCFLGLVSPTDGNSCWGFSE